MSHDNGIRGLTMPIIDEIRMSEAELKAINQFKKQHKKCWKPTAIGGDFSYIITPTGIGRLLSIRCGHCGKDEDVSDI